MLLQALIASFAWCFGFVLPPVESESLDITVGAVYSEHQGGLVTLATEADGMVLIAFAGDKASMPSAFAGGGCDIEEPVPVLRATWKSADNVQHEVVTPVVSTTPAGLRKAEDLHDALVASQKRRYPPV